MTGLALFGNNLFVVNGLDGTIGEYTTSGSTVNASLISGLDGPVLGVAINPVPEPPGGVLAALCVVTFCLPRWRK